MSDLGSLGPRKGPAISVACPLPDSLRSIYLWLLPGGLLLLRRANRTRSVWVVVLPLLATYAILHVAERTVSSQAFFCLTPYLCSLACEMLRALALGLAVLLTVSDWITIRSRVLRAVLTFAILVLTGGAAAALNAPLSLVVSTKPTSYLSPAQWGIVFGIMVLIFLIGLSIILALLRWLAGGRALVWCGRVCFALGIASVPVLVGVKLLIDSADSMGGPLYFFYFYGSALLEAFLAPYLVFFWFVLPALWSPFYRQRFANCFAGRAWNAGDISRVSAMN